MTISRFECRFKNSSFWVMNRVSSRVSNRMDEYSKETTIPMTRPTSLLAPLAIAPDDGEYSDPELSYSDEEDDSNTTELLDIDARSLGSPEKLAKYAETIFTIAQSEQPTIPQGSQLFLQTQTEITPPMYELAVRWLFQISKEWDLCSNTLYQAVAFLRVVLSKSPVAREKLQLVTITCIWMACKIEELTVMKLDEMVTISSGSYTVADFIQCERELIMMLDIRMNYVTPRMFLRRFLDIIDAGKDDVGRLSRFFCYLSLGYIEFMDFPPDVIALASVCLGKLCLNEFCPIKRLCAYGHIECTDMMKACCAKLLLRAKEVGGNRRHFLHTKYTSEAHRMVFAKANFGIDVINHL